MADNSLKIKKSLSFTPQATPPANPQIGDIYLDSTQNKLLQYNGSTWVQTGNDLLDVLLQQNFNLASLTDFTQTGLELITSPTIQGAKSARLIHQAATTYSFQETKSVDRKYRGKNNTLSMIARSSASSANVTLEVTGTNGVTTTTLLSSTFTTGQITASVFNTTSGLPTVTVTDNAILNQIIAGATITGSGIPTGTTVLSVGSSSITLSANATATATGVGLKVSSLPKSQNFSFEIPADYNSITYKVSALAEAGLPETYVDDIVIELTEMAMTSTSVTVPTVDIVQSSSLNQTTSIGTATITGALATNSNTGIFSYDPVTGIYTVSKNSKFNISASLRSSGAAASLPVIVINGAETSASSTSPLANYWNSVSWSGDLLAGQTFFVKNAGNPCDIQRIYVSARTNPSTETKTIPLSSSVIVTEPDSYLQMNGFSVAAGSVGTKILTLASPTYLKNEGSAFRYVKDSVNGDYVEALLDGQYSFSFNFDSNVTGTTNYTLGFSKNSTQLTTDYTGINPENQLRLTYTQDAPHLTWSGVLKSGDKIRIHSVSNGHLISQGLVYSQFSVSYVGSTKILNPSSDQKVDIPIHELRLEGTSARGSVATFIVKFDTLAKIKGDGFEVVNTVADGTYIRIKKAGRLLVNANVYLNGSADLAISKNQSVLTAMPVGSEIEAWIGVNPSRANLPATIDVVPNDIIRVASTLTPTAISSNILSLKLQEQSVAVALQNVAPRWDDSDFSLMLSGGNGLGSTATTVRRFSNVVNNVGSSITYTDSPTAGATFLVNETGLYSIKYQDETNTTSPTSLGITQGSSVGPAGYAYQSFGVSGVVGIESGEIYLTKGTTFVVGTVNPANINSTTAYTRLYIAKVGKTQGTVDVTPFVQIPQNEVEAIEALTTTSTFGSTNTGVPVLNITKNTNKGIIQVLSSTAEGTSFKVLKDCELKISTTYSSTTANGGTGFITRNATVLTAASPDGIITSVSTAGAGNPMITSASISVLANDVIRVQRDNGTVNQFVKLILTATALSPSIATPTEQVSSDTIPFVFKATAITDSDPVGTFNTYTYAANTNTATISATAPTQSTSSMNINGIQVFGRAYNATSTAAQPARVDIKIGRGLKSVQLDAYGVSSKSTPIGFNRSFTGNAGEEVGANYFYNETTGVLTIDAGLAFSGSNVARAIDSNRTHSNGYFVFNASKSPSLVSIPNLQQRVALVKYDTPSSRMTLSSTFTTVPLTSSTDPSGIVSIAANQITLQPGQYLVEISAYFYTATSLQQCFSKFRNATDTVDEFYLMPMSSGTNGINQTIFSSGSDIITINSTKSFDVLARVSSGTGYIGDTYGTEADKLIVKITKIK